jgi:type VI protein secretion system component VasK
VNLSRSSAALPPWCRSLRARTGGDAGHCAALVAIDRNSWSRFIGEWSRLSECATFLAGYILPRTDVHQMRENLSLLSFWGLVFSLIAVTLFVVIYSYQKSKYANREIVEDLRQRSVDVYLAAKTPEAESDSKRFREASNEIERLRAETRVLFWLIIAMNTAVIIIFILAYQYF